MHLTTQPLERASRRLVLFIVGLPVDVTASTSFAEGFGAGGDVVAIETPIECVDEFHGLRCCREATELSTSGC